ncbi:MAG: 16S rRNA (guanine(966)-N(2))-methyltransferase RsmD [Candidatus Cloacimonadaceae bacterium]|jgi:16S rRNA (guanine966-N2)-methyltransferase|nr:16S rRNA (guanine(966)-N(2))-methyltransferase RsmD [Candidatus Cloacimonadota bacterium]MDD3533852.1 16S rRNA (guanine(966)-N(2))-methyltransferase RsmD [Candidatus Cloacimonadota bacterium]MDY0126931.1 16S rRNA (guanine(966)-N(2))-methyltransferase RsmD [Candidatus Cloacimonadaceae bacterium]
MIRIIAGKYKKRKLAVVPGRSTRPTSDFNREMVFSTYQDYEDKCVLDLFAGTGALGLEALSRGAAWVDFVEFATPAIATILSNIRLLGCEDSCHLYRKKVHSYLKNCTEKYDIIFIDPPYDKNLVNPTLRSIFEHDILAEDGVIVVEHASAELINLDLADRIFQQKSSKSNSFTWLQK